MAGVVVTSYIHVTRAGTAHAPEKGCIHSHDCEGSMRTRPEHALNTLRTRSLALINNNTSNCPAQASFH